MQENQVGYSDFAEQFSDMYAEFRALVEQEKQNRAGENNVINAAKAGSTTALDVSAS